MTSDATHRTMREMMRGDLREMSSVWWWFLLLGILWTLFGMFVLSYRVGSLTEPDLRRIHPQGRRKAGRADRRLTASVESGHALDRRRRSPTIRVTICAVLAPITDPATASPG